jgi:hypothetical protein
MRMGKKLKEKNVFQIMNQQVRNLREIGSIAADFSTYLKSFINCISFERCRYYINLFPVQIV